MSRIDEALGRATAGAPRTESASLSETISIERYAPESPRKVEFPRPRAKDLGPERPAERPSFALTPDLQGKLVIGKEIPPASVEQYRRVATSLHEFRAQHGVKTLVVSSAIPKEGKTLTTANVALTLSQSYSGRVLVIDADLRRPAIHSVFGIPDGRGLGDVLASGGPLPLVDVSDTLAVLIAGRPCTNAIGLLSSERMTALIADVANRFDWVIIDTPPAGALPDARVLSNLVDAVLFVIDVNATPYDAVQRAVKELGADRIIGSVLNRIDPRALPQNSYYDYYSATR